MRLQILCRLNIKTSSNGRMEIFSGFEMETFYNLGSR